MQYSSLISPLLNVSKEAGSAIMQYYDTELDIEIKDDNSPLTKADLAANDCIIAELKKIAPQIPIVSEEEKNQQFDANSTFFLVDPLDGTKSFIKHTGEFTVNIGLIENGKPVLGVVYVPFSGELYYTGENGKAFKWTDGDDAPVEISCREPSAEGLVVMASQSHLTQETEDYISGLNVSEFIAAGSSLKFCLVAEGKADIYPRFGPTMEWDTAAAHAVLLAAGGDVLKPDGDEFTYGKKDYRNSYFIATGL